MLDVVTKRKPIYKRREYLTQIKVIWPKKKSKHIRIINNITITISNNNTFINLSKTFYGVLKGQRFTDPISNSLKTSRTLTYTSGGLCGFTGSKKASPMANATIGEVAALKFKKFGIRQFNLFLYGSGKKKKETMKGFIKYGLNIRRIEQKIPVPHNGTRHAKKRRK
jgi:ribosomal protein S11